MYCIVLYCIVLYCIVLYCIVLYCIVCIVHCVYILAGDRYVLKKATLCILGAAVELVFVQNTV